MRAYTIERHLNDKSIEMCDSNRWFHEHWLLNTFCGCAAVSRTHSIIAFNYNVLNAHCGRLVAAIAAFFSSHFVIWMAVRERSCHQVYFWRRESGLFFFFYIFHFFWDRIINLTAKITAIGKYRWRKIIVCLQNDMRACKWLLYACILWVWMCWNGDLEISNWFSVANF